MATVINRSLLTREANAIANSAPTVYALQLDLTNYRGYNWGAAGNSARAKWTLRVAGVAGSSFSNCLGEWTVHVTRTNGGAPTVAMFADGNNTTAALAGVFADVSGNVVRFGVGSFSELSNAAVLFELDGPIIDLAAILA